MSKQPAKRANTKPPPASMPVVPATLPVLPVSDMVVFPSMIAPLVVSTERSTRLVDEVVSGDRQLILALQRNPEQPDDQVTFDGLHAGGCLARLIKMLKFPDNTIRMLVQGQQRCRLVRPMPHATFLVAEYAVVPDEKDAGLELTALARNASTRFQEIISLSPTLPEELKIALFNMDDPVKLSDLIASHLNMSLEERQALLEDPSPTSRLNRLTALLNREMEVLRLGTEIQHKVSEQLSKTQRTFFLREQLKEIRRELGEEDQQTADIQDIEKRLADAKLPEEAAEVAAKEAERLKNIPPASPEYAVVRNYLEWIAELPWAVSTTDVLDIAKARAILDADHYDLTKVKDRILEYLAVLKLKRDLKGPILCFVGPPGVGKTSLGQSIARALGRKFVRMSLGGVRDEAEIRGHRRTYIGALPGRILQGLKKAGTNNPVFMLDEIDKLGVDFRGDPSSALLEVLDPQQNHAFSDHYLNVPFDLSNVLFIATGNLLDPVPPALRDRMETLELPGYTPSEKKQIAVRYLIPRQLEAHGLKAAQLKIEAPALEQVIAHYTREAGVRNLERELAGICRKVARGVAEGRKRKVAVRPRDLHGYLGPIKFEAETAEPFSAPGVVTGLAWTPTGGDILFIEATQMPGKGNLILTGSLGDVMKESARAALSYARANSERWKPPVRVEENRDMHIHVPAGSIPKDGPSAGLAMALALYSLLEGKPFPSDLAVTGEITLRGKVMPVGGIKEKVLAAHRAGIRTVMLPDKNRRNLEDIPPEVRRAVRFRFVDTIDKALNAVRSCAREAPPRKKARRTRG